MSLHGTGTDRVDLDRLRPLLDGHGGRFLERCFRPDDLAREAEPAEDRLERVAASWAAKEALLKALGTDLRRLPYRDVALVREPGGEPGIRLHGAAREAMRRSGASSVRVAISTSETAAAAWVVLESG